MRVAVVGGGVSGLVAAWLLSRQYQVTLFEAEAQLGGHTCTLPVDEDGQALPIDIGFIVCNDRTYPNFLRLLAELGVSTEASSMSFSVRCERTGLEYNGSSLDQLFAQRRNLLRPSFYRMLLDILRFHRLAPQALADDGRQTTREFLAAHGFTGRVVEHYLVPMSAAIWSTPPDRVLDFPVRTLVEFLTQHGMLTVNDRPQWRVVRGGSQVYVDALSTQLRDAFALATPIAWIKRQSDRVVLKTQAGDLVTCDRVVIAAHSDQALALLADPSPAEREILGAIPYQPNHVVLHTDSSFLPRRPRAWASWNYHLLASPPEDRPGVRMTYYMNQLQNLKARRHYCVTLNRTAEIRPECILAERTFAHPLYTTAGIRAQTRWSEINRDRTYFCGAYWGFGFHEDGVKSAVEVARALGVAW